MGCMRQNLTTFAQTALFLSPWNLASDPQPRKEQHCSDGVWGSTPSRGWGCRISGQRGRQALVPSLPSEFFLCSKRLCVTEPFCFSWYKFAFAPSVADPGLLHTSCALGKEREHNEKMSNQQQTEDFTAYKSLHAEEQSCFPFVCFCICSHTCMKCPRNVHSMTNYCKSQVLVPPFSY